MGIIQLFTSLRSPGGGGLELELSLAINSFIDFIILKWEKKLFLQQLFFLSNFIEIGGKIKSNFKFFPHPLNKILQRVENKI